MSGARAWPGLVFAVVASLVLARVVAHPLSTLPGRGVGDSYKHAWALWHDLAMIGGGTWPFTPYLAAPRGGALFDVMLGPALLLAPVTGTLGPVFAANLWTWLGLFGIGLSVFALSRRLGAGPAGGLAAGLLAMGSPYLAGFPLTSGVLERVPMWLFPLLLLGALRVREGGRWTPWLLGAFTLVTFGCPAYGLFAALMVALALPALLWLPERGPGVRVRVARLLPLLMGMALLGLGLWRLVSWVAHRVPYVAEDRAGVMDFKLGVVDLFTGTTPGILLSPSRSGLLPELPTDTQTVRIAYLGGVLLLASLGGLGVALRRRRWLAAWVVALGLLFAGLSLGPFFHIGAQRYLNPLGFVAGWLVPFYGSGPSMWQQVAVFSVLAPVGAGLLVSAPGRGWVRWSLAGALVLGAWAERAWVLPVPLVLDAAPARISPVYDAIGDDGMVLDLPRMSPAQVPGFGRVERTRDRALLAQTRHHRPVPYALNAHLSAWDAYPLVAEGAASDWSGAAACLHEAGIRWLVVHPGWYAEPAQGRAAVSSLDRLVGGTAASDSDILLFDLDRLASAEVDPACPVSRRAP